MILTLVQFVASHMASQPAGKSFQVQSQEAPLVVVLKQIWFLISHGHNCKMTAYTFWAIIS